MTIPFPAHAWPLLRAALQHIADHPEEFWMQQFTTSPEYVKELRGVDSCWLPAQLPPPGACGTIACLGGRIALIHDPSTVHVTSFTVMRALGLPDIFDDYHERWEDETSQALDDVFQDMDIDSYPDLKNALLARFTFPEPLPSPSAVTA
ncbi:hypothetical protein [Kineosporia succinea]|uniref:Uncharacterized protein n=1 Tax=Kineosporia succinea TaxID=84632 RepID=A0ABT9P9F6_9ACTN|nr:hypothetical protein [Kineosporia succinea]MDP9829331.1 hypothetical protein [Kineosporia succinea]